MKFPNNDFLIFNDSCYSGSMIDLIDSYNRIYDLKVSSEITEKINPQVLFSFMNLFKSVIKNKDITNSFHKVTELITFYQNIKEIDIDDVKNKVCLNENEVNLCETIGLKKEDINNFYLIFNSYESIEKSDSLLERYNKSREIFNENNMNIIQKLVNDDLNEFIHTLECLYPCRKTIDFVLPPHKNIEIISSTDSKSICFSFTSIRINEMTKVNPGSPAMSSFIKEVFMIK
ncbi:hypothetical protein M9Y10_010960 [Tritrichomonas musculus]|uniref:Clan CD, family C14, metacaspase-like cysteine peptidase n=1 Tax=Tritrichomonas musculus TaxID=1915356 RepID=A0ABR2IPN4_9EUKA